MTTTEHPASPAAADLPREERKGWLDLGAFDMEAASRKGRRIVLLHPLTAEGMRAPDGREVAITIYGPDAPEARRAFPAARKEIARRMEEMTPEQRRIFAEDPNTDFVVACEATARLVKGWEAIGWDGEERALTIENAVAFFRKFPHWHEQVHAEVQADRIPFLPAPPPPPAPAPEPTTEPPAAP